MIVKSLLWCAKLLLGGWRGKLMRWSPVMRRSQLSGVWMLSLKQPNRRALWSNAAKSSAFCCAKTYIGGVRIVGHSSRQRLCPNRTAVVTHYSQPPEGSTTVCTDELVSVVPRTFAPAPGWSPTGHRIKALLDYRRGPEKTWVFGTLRVCDGKELTRCAASHNSLKLYRLTCRH